MANSISNLESKVVKAIVGELDDGYRHRPGELFRFMLSEIMHLWGYPYWMEVPEAVRGKIAQAISAYDEAISVSEPFFDILGLVYQEIASNGGRAILNQYFTPWSLASMMSTMLDPKPVRANGFTTACDPACGSGVLMLSMANQVLKTSGPKALKAFSFHGCDIDPICARMMSIQFLANCASHQIEVGEVIVFCGDSLSSHPKPIVVHATAPDVRVAPANALFRQALIAEAARSAGVLSPQT